VPVLILLEDQECLVVESLKGVMIILLYIYVGMYRVVLQTIPGERVIGETCKVECVKGVE